MRTELFGLILSE